MDILSYLHKRKAQRHSKSTPNYFFSKKGFTLMEIIISMLILSLVVAGIYGLFINSTKYIVETQHRLQAVNYARTIAETLNHYVSADSNIDGITNAGTGPNCALEAGTHSYTEIDVAIPDDYLIDVTNPSASYVVDEDATIEASETDIAAGTPTYATDLEEVTITVSWDEMT